MKGIRKTIYVDKQTLFYLRALEALDKGKNSSKLIQQGLKMLYWHEMEARGWGTAPSASRPILPRLRTRNDQDDQA